MRKFVNIALLLSVITVLFPSAVMAQSAQVNFPYTCSFEDPNENANWVLNSVNQTDMCEDRWYVGRAAFSDGMNSLYISFDNGNTTNHGPSKNVVVAYREIEFPTGYYTFTFDWKNGAKSGSGMYFCLIQKQKGAPQSSSGSSLLVDLLDKGAREMTREDGSKTKCLRGARAWEMAKFSTQINKQTFYVAFVWQNADTDTTTMDRLAACVDNFQITSSKCKMPSDLQIKSGCDTVDLSWYGTAAEYHVEYKKNDATTWRKKGGISENRLTIIGLAEGAYDFRVCGVNGTDTSAYLKRNAVPVFCPENHCIDYVHLDNSEVVTCKVGAALSSSHATCAPIDFGPDEAKSRHTTYWIKNQYDPLTEYKLPTIPEGEIASVRLGNWLTGAQAESIEYKYYVDKETPGILILKYAVILQNPGHLDREQPFFQLTLLKNRGVNVELDPDCGKAEFTAGKDTKGWHVSRPFADKEMKVEWKEWTTLGLNLEPYKGDTIKIRLTTRDCSQGAHFGYAYFTLGCSSGTIESVSCGATEEQEIVAPLGFKYEWFKEYTPDSLPVKVLSTERSFKVPPTDNDPYHCRCTFMEKSGCWFDLHTVISPRFPYADFELEHCPKDCKNSYRLRNKSHVILDFGDSIVHTDSKVETYYWYQEDGSVITDESPVFVAPNEGCTVNVRLDVGIADDECTDDTVIQVVVPSILTEDVTIDTTICASAFPYYWESAEQVLGEPGTYYDHRKNYAGCDSLTILNLHSTPDIEDAYIDTVICYGDSVVFSDSHGYRKVCSTTDKYTVTLFSRYGCDSVIHLNLTVHDKVTFSYDKTDVAGQPNSGSITISDAPEGYTYTLNGVTEAPLTGLAGGVYELVVLDSLGCMSDPVSVTIDSECIEYNLDLSAPLSACAGDEQILRPIEFLKGAPTTYDIEYAQEALDAGFANYTDTFDVAEITILIPQECRPGHYDATLIIRDIVCDDIELPLKVDILYPSDIIVQKWNDVLAVKNAKYNGGYEFVAYQWYKDDVLLPGATVPYYYTSENASLDTAGQYHVVLVRADDGVQVATCPMSPVVKSDVAEYPQRTVVPAGAGIQMMNVGRGSVTVSFWNISGLYCGSYLIDGHNCGVPAPAVPGAYVMVVEKGGVSRQYKIVVI